MNTSSLLRRLDKLKEKQRAAAAERHAAAAARLSRRSSIMARLDEALTAAEEGRESLDLSEQDAKDRRVCAAWDAAHSTPKQRAARRKTLIASIEAQVAAEIERRNRPLEPEVLAPLRTEETRAPVADPLEGRIVQAEPVRKRLSDGMPANVETETQLWNEERNRQRRLRDDGFRQVAWPAPMPGAGPMIDDDGERRW